MPLFQRRTEALCHCASILEEKGALTRSSSLYFRGEGRSCCLLMPLFQRRTEALCRCASILDEKGAVKVSYCLYFRAERNLCRGGRNASILEENRGSLSLRLYCRGEGSLDTELLPLFQRRREELLPLNPSILEENRGSLPLRLYFRGEGSRQSELPPLFQSRTESLSRRTECLYFRGEQRLFVIAPLFQRRREP